MVPSGSQMIHSGGRVECSHAGLEVPPGGVAPRYCWGSVWSAARPRVCKLRYHQLQGLLMVSYARNAWARCWVGAGGGDARRLIVVASAPSGRVMILVGSLQELVPRAGGLRVAAGRVDIETSRVRRVDQ